jgi:hypothetical protein
MRPLRRFVPRVFNFTVKHRDDERFREEMKEHVALQAEENIRLQPY